MERATVRVTGVVQSVGFRPFVYRSATALGLRGTVRNLGDAGVRIELEGDRDQIEAFLATLREDPPPLAQVDTVEIEREQVGEGAFDTFEILESEAGQPESSGSNGVGTIPPDTAICDACLADVRDAASRYHQYWATACVDCGPRFTVVESLPYDRPTTSMAAFPMCADCLDEYDDPADRRYHAQAIACPQCGPSLRYGLLEESDAETGIPDAGSDGRDPFPEALSATVDGPQGVGATARLLADGGIVVIKGIGGAHLACDGTDPNAVASLRDRTGRPSKPFALMVRDVDATRQLARLSNAECGALTSPRRPILLVDEREESGVAAGVAPGLHTVGVMLPYAGVHHLLFDHLDGPIVLTSANLPGRPMLVENGSLVDRLADVADAALLHDRRIVARCDDSVARIVDDRRRLVRRSRGFVPRPVPIPGTRDMRVLALGPELDVAPGILADGDCYLTQYVGDVDNLETFEYLREAVDHLLSVSGLDRPSVVAHDLHPAFHTTDHAHRLEQEAGLQRVAVQHHHAHAASVLAEHDRRAAIAVTVDGVGYGPDGTIWGGEVLDATHASYDRVGGLAPMAMPGGDRATRYPGRMLAGALFARDGDPGAVEDVLAQLDVGLPGGETERDLVCQQLDAGVNTPETTSAGRFLDAVSALLGVCEERTYEGEPAMKLEAVASSATADRIDLPVDAADGRTVLDAPELLARLIEMIAEGNRKATIAATAQEALARGLAVIAVEAAGDAGHDAVALSGGVAYNDAIAARIRQHVEDAGLEFIGNELVPPGDGGIAYGQAAVAAARQN